MKKRREKLNQEPREPVGIRKEGSVSAEAEADFAAQLAEMIRAELEAPGANNSDTRPFHPVDPGVKPASAPALRQTRRRSRMSSAESESEGRYPYRRRSIRAPRRRRTARKMSAR